MIDLEDGFITDTVVVPEPHVHVEVGTPYIYDQLGEAIPFTIWEPYAIVGFGILMAIVLLNKNREGRS